MVPAGSSGGSGQHRAMQRLTRYLIGRFAVAAAGMFAMAMVLFWLVQTLRLFELVTVRGQDMLTLAAHAALTTPPLAKTILYVCMGLGLARTLSAMQSSQELHAIHASRRAGALFRAATVFALTGGLLMLAVLDFAEPAANRTLGAWQTRIAADLVGRAIVPNRFTEVVPGVVMHIGGRGNNGQITEFFADDRRDPAMRRSYMADRATLGTDPGGYVLQLEQGRMQYLDQSQRLSEIAFARYEVPLGNLTGTVTEDDAQAQRSSFELIAAAAISGQWSPELHELLRQRLGEVLRVVGLSLLVVSIAGFPHGRRGRVLLPIEILVVGIVLVERILALVMPLPPALAQLGGATAMLLAALVVYGMRAGLGPRTRRARAA